MFTVDPRGSTKLETGLLIPKRSSAHSMETGSVADDDDVDARPATGEDVAAEPPSRGEIEIVVRWIHNPNLEVKVADDDPTTRLPNSLCIVLS